MARARRRRSAAALALLQPYPAEEMRAAEASMLVNSVKNDDLRLFDPAEAG